MITRQRSPQLLALAFACGAAIGCQAEHANPEHCHYAAGDLTCADLYGEDRPFCVGPADGCPGAEAHYGCVAEPPAYECHSPCGAGTFASEDNTCPGSDDESEAEADGGDTPECGNGVTEADEQCDDGNEINDDACSNACILSICGDGITQATIGETCDDGNTQSGDECASNCTLPGTVIWSKIYEFESCDAAAVAVTSMGGADLVFTCGGPRRKLMGVDSNGDELWTVSTPTMTSGNPSIAVSNVDPDKFVIGGQLNGQGHVRYHKSNGSYDWISTIPLDSSTVYNVAIDNLGAVVAAGEVAGEPMLHHFTATGELEWSHFDASGGDFFAVATGPDNQIWVLQSLPFQVHSYSATGELLWTSASLIGHSKDDIGVDAEGNAFVVGNTAADNIDNFRIHKLGPDGVETWYKIHPSTGVDAHGNAIAVLPNGTSVVAGYTVGESQSQVGLLSWHSAAGTNLQEITYEDDDHPTTLFDVAVSTQGYAVAVGTCGPLKQLCLLKVTL
ncbi:Molybdopterin oxidoreductase, iron-sulfur binding subunit [Enhygromyxa salina]|uniref:Molybdopterin oxidoreductase, iron-sulfur binding subunit n=2 Tax=Enhygromyxa salina TaxID=215803 RepID=A0A0C1ZC58_9BACT|nr:Molybdopterin oxidoreductase, iron-sulfur binding subunit [Enhygromyxa salina]